MSARTRCPLCEHPRKRRITATRQTKGVNLNVDPHVRKHPCECDCHESTEAAS